MPHRQRDNQTVAPRYRVFEVLEDTKEAPLNSLFAATTTRGFAGHVAEALPVDRVLEILGQHRALAAPASATKP